jgi:GrpB-like predicted nucleotidyltransferase (UPF0157 family)
LKPVTLVEPYNPEWPGWFLQLNALLGRTLAGHLYAIEHVGSTSVPGMVAKPKIDIDIVMREGQLEKIKSYLEALGYVYEGDLGIAERHCFDLRSELRQALPMHNLYAFEKDAEELRRHLLFRDYLRAHPEARRKLSEVKLAVAAEVDNDIHAYAKGKSPTVQEILALALAEQETNV